MSNTYYTGGISEIVARPSLLTASFFQYWIRGSRSLGTSCQKLKVPYASVDTSLLLYQDQQFFIDVEVEQKTLYQPSLLQYQSRSGTDKPKMFFNWSQLLFPSAIYNTGKLLIRQSLWINNQDEMISQAHAWIASLSQVDQFDDIKSCDQQIAEKVLPTVLAIGTLAEFYKQTLYTSYKHNRIGVEQYISTNVSQKDWLYLSVMDMYAVKTGDKSWEEFIADYGLRADQDYELSCPRWYEIPKKIKKRISDLKQMPNKDTSTVKNDFEDKLIQTNIEFQIMRSEAKQAFLPYIDQLRQLIIKIAGTEDIEQLTREQLLESKAPKFEIDKSKVSKKRKKTTAKLKGKKGQGRGVSAGMVTAMVQHVDSADQTVNKNKIGIFPNSSPEFSIQFTQCHGLIFLKGGMSSHGAIVARELGIPALVEPRADHIPDGTTIHINGSTGEWEIEE